MLFTNFFRGKKKLTNKESPLKIAVITSISGMSNKLKNPKIIFDNVDYFAFVDEIQHNSIWNQRLISDFTIDDKYQGRRNAKIFKVLPHLFLPEYDYFFWVDSTHELILDPYYVIKNIISEADIALFRHSQRNCVYDEADELIKLNYDHVNLINSQIDFYKSKNFPKNVGLFELPCSIRKNTPQINTLNLMWWELICKYSSRDQISLPFAMHKLSIEPFILDGFANNGFYSNKIMPQVRNKFY
ncbi:glycosyltransferase domain-containing protein [Aquirufa sp. A-Brett2-W8]|jgi:hypothetical protein